eukprot:scaffold104508_cov54-Phaeocystis_antarctica.AAC.1
MYKQPPVRAPWPPLRYRSLQARIFTADVLSQAAAALLQGPCFTLNLKTSTKFQPGFTRCLRPRLGPGLEGEGPARAPPPVSCGFSSCTAGWPVIAALRGRPRHSGSSAPAALAQHASEAQAG